MKLLLTNIKDGYKYAYDKKEYMNKPKIDESWIYMGEAAVVKDDKPKMEDMSLKEQAKVKLIDTFIFNRS